MEGFFEKLEKLQQKPEHERKRIALISTSVIFLVIFVVWAATWNAKLSRLARGGGEENPAKSPSKIIGDFLKGVEEDLHQAAGTVDAEISYVRSQISTSTIEDIRREIAGETATGTASSTGNAAGGQATATAAFSTSSASTTP